MTSLSQVEQLFVALFEALRAEKPEDRSSRDRAYAVTLTELEKVFAYYQVYALWNGGKGDGSGDGQVG